MSSTREDWLLSQERRPHPDRLCHKPAHLPSRLLRAPSSLLKVICSPLSWLRPPYSSSIKTVCKLSNLTNLLSIHHFSLWCLHAHNIKKWMHLYTFVAINLPAVSLFHRPGYLTYRRENFSSPIVHKNITVCPRVPKLLTFQTKERPCIEGDGNKFPCALTMCLSHTSLWICVGCLISTSWQTPRTWPTWHHSLCLSLVWFVSCRRCLKSPPGDTEQMINKLRSIQTMDEWKATTMKTHYMYYRLLFIWSSGPGRTHLWWQKSEQWLPLDRKQGDWKGGMDLFYVLTVVGAT